jgi:hypothetical protein
MRMRSALSVLEASGELPPTALERVQAELREAQARAEASGSGVSAAKGKVKAKGKGKQPQQQAALAPRRPSSIAEQPDIEDAQGDDDDDGAFESDLDAGDDVGSSAGAGNSASPRRPFARGIDDPRSANGGPSGLGTSSAPPFTSRVEDGPPTADGFANDDLYSYHLPSLTAAAGGVLTAAGSNPYARPSSAAATSMRAQAHAQAALFGTSRSGSRSPYAGPTMQQQHPSPNQAFAGQQARPETGSFRSASPQGHRHASASRDFAGQLAAPSTSGFIDPSLAPHHPMTAPQGRYFAPGLPPSSQRPYPPVFSPTMISSSNGGYSAAVAEAHPAYAPVPPAVPHQFDELIPLRSSSKSLATLLRPRGFGPTCDGGADSLAAAEAAAAAEERAARQDVVRMGLVSEQEARALYAFFMDKVGGLIYLFDPELHMHDAVRRSSPLLYATILAIALRFNNAPEELHQRVLAVARDNVLLVLADNIRSEETILAL